MGESSGVTPYESAIRSRSRSFQSMHRRPAHAQTCAPLGWAMHSAFAALLLGCFAAAAPTTHVNMWQQAQQDTWVEMSATDRVENKMPVQGYFPFNEAKAKKWGIKIKLPWAHPAWSRYHWDYACDSVTLKQHPEWKSKCQQEGKYVTFKCDKHMDTKYQKDVCGDGDEFTQKTYDPTVGHYGKDVPCGAPCGEETCRAHQRAKAWCDPDYKWDQGYSDWDFDDSHKPAHYHLDEFLYHHRCRDAKEDDVAYWGAHIGHSVPTREFEQELRDACAKGAKDVTPKSQGCNTGWFNHGKLACTKERERLWCPPDQPGSDGHGYCCKAGTWVKGNCNGHTDKSAFDEAVDAIKHKAMAMFTDKIPCHTVHGCEATAIKYAMKAACTTAENWVDKEIRLALASCTGGISVAVNAGTQIVTGLGGLVGIGPGHTDMVNEADKLVMKAVGCAKYMSEELLQWTHERH